MFPSRLIPYPYPFFFFFFFGGGGGGREREEGAPVVHLVKLWSVDSIPKCGNLLTVNWVPLLTAFQYHPTIVLI